MGSYVEIDGHPTWVQDCGGSGDPLLLLHGGLSNSDFLLDGVGQGLTERYRVVAFDRRGHGYTADTDADFHYEDMAKEAVGVLREMVDGPAHLVGWSDGGIIALLIALHHPELVRKLVVIGTNYHHDGVLPVEPDTESPFVRAIAAGYIQRSPDGAEHLDVAFGKTLAMFNSEPILTTDDLAVITPPTLVVAADDDLVSLSHTCSLFEALPQGQLAIVPGTSHALPVEQPAVLAGLILDFLTTRQPPPTQIPVRRATAVPN